jgi:hypothetical protein
MRCRLAPVRPLSVVRDPTATKRLTEPSLMRYCAHPSCKALLLTLPGATLTRTCDSHAGQRPPEESDEERMERVCREMGWRRAKERR